MSYMRGKYYRWNDGNFLHLSNDVIPMSVFDELVVMRYEQMTPSQRKRTEKRAIKYYSGNFGCDSLCVKYKKKTTIELMNSINKIDKNNKITIIEDKNIKKDLLL